MAHGISGQDEARLCSIEQSLGREQACPGVGCALWDDRGGECVVDELHLDVRRAPELAAYLAQLRARMEEAA